MKYMRDLHKRINKFNAGEYPGTYLVQDGNDNLLAGVYIILNIKKNYVCQLLNVMTIGRVEYS
jgi:hypothetical protein